MEFTKMQGLGNDFIVVNNIKENIKNPSEVAQIICDRHFGIGADGLLLIEASQCADYKMILFNADGSEAEMCGNGIRCIAKYIYSKMEQKKVLTIETLAGVKTLEIQGNDVRVDMGEPILASEKVPVISNSKEVVNEKFMFGKDETYEITAVSMGNPHAVLYVNDVDTAEVERIGKLIENNTNIFPKRTNVEFVQVIDPKHTKIRVWERGVGETLACGTGTCASIVASVLNNKTDRDVEVTLPGGKLYITWAENNHIFMTGNADIVFEGVIFNNK